VLKSVWTEIFSLSRRFKPLKFEVLKSFWTEIFSLSRRFKPSKRQEPSKDRENLSTKTI